MEKLSSQLFKTSDLKEADDFARELSITAPEHVYIIQDVRTEIVYIEINDTPFIRSFEKVLNAYSKGSVYKHSYLL